MGAFLTWQAPQRTVTVLIYLSDEEDSNLVWAIHQQSDAKTSTSNQMPISNQTPISNQMPIRKAPTSWAAKLPSS